MINKIHCIDIIFFFALITSDCHAADNSSGDWRNTKTAEPSVLSDPIPFIGVLNRWNKISVDLADNDKLARVSTMDCVYGLCGFNIDKSQKSNTPFFSPNSGGDVRTYRRVCVAVARTPNAKIDLDQERLFKLEVNDIPLIAEDKAWRSELDTTYIANRTGLVCFKLETPVAEPIVKVQFVFWQTRIDGLILRAWFIKE